ncbi:hypothetical protein M413DRAFT_370905 [Hebeloma cylindrosporum]|uniref:Uncharacterized protein n=1 Tax=Hebeloma cylindrosporum TaxID=76867 RepID=A0A0C2Y201_HEBCY|nr:hypothetical protein M413DRAFT_370905 [Hebeloma cylindrosporum h7]
MQCTKGGASPFLHSAPTLGSIQPFTNLSLDLLGMKRYRSCTTWKGIELQFRCDNQIWSLEIVRVFPCLADIDSLRCRFFWGNSQKRKGAVKVTRFSMNAYHSSKLKRSTCAMT